MAPRRGPGKTDGCAHRPDPVHGAVRADVDVVLLDAGNTLAGMDMALLADVATAEGVAVTPDALARAEAAARPAVSRAVAAGASGEARTTFVVYVEAMLAALGRPPADCRAVAPRLAAAVKRVPTTRLWARVLPGVPAALGRLRAAGLGLVVVSNSDGTCEETLVRLGLRDAVDAVVDSMRVGFEKPDPRIFAAALATCGATPARGVHVGDLYDVDVIGARRAGLRAVLLDPHDDWAGVDCPRAADLAAFVDGLVGRGA